MNKNELFSTIINDYKELSDNNHIQTSDREVKPNGDTENRIMNDLWTQVIDHIFVSDKMVFNKAFVEDGQVFLSFSQTSNKDSVKSVVNVDETMIPEDYIDIRMKLLKDLDVQ